MNILVVIILVIASLSGTALIGYAIMSGQRQREALNAMAREKGWRLDHQTSSGRGGTRTEISDPNDNWTCIIFVKTGENGSSTRWTGFNQPDLGIDRGLAVLGPDIPDQTASMFETLLSQMGRAEEPVDNSLQGALLAAGRKAGQQILERFTGGLSDVITDLRHVPYPGSGTLLATPDAESALDAIREAPELAEARKGRNEAEQVMAQIGRFGFRLRQTGSLRKPAEIEAFIDLGRSLSDRLRQG